VAPTTRRRNHVVLSRRNRANLQERLCLEDTHDSTAVICMCVSERTRKRGERERKRKKEKERTRKIKRKEKKARGEA